MITSVDAQNVFNKIQIPLLKVKKAEQTSYESDIPQPDKIYQIKIYQVTSFLIVKQNVFLLKSGTRKGFMNSSLLFNIILAALAKGIREGREGGRGTGEGEGKGESKGTQTGKKERNSYL